MNKQLTSGIQKRKVVGIGTQFVAIMGEPTFPFPRAPSPTSVKGRRVLMCLWRLVTVTVAIKVKSFNMEKTEAKALRLKKSIFSVLTPTSF